MKKKRKKLSKKRKIILITSIALILLIILCIALSVKRSVDEKNDGKITSLQEMVERCDCRFISSRESSEAGYAIDIYLEFKYSPYQDERSQKPYYDVVITGIANYLKYQNFRLIDESKELTIAVNCYGETVNKVTINGTESSEYFNKLVSDRNKENNLELPEIDVKLNQVLSLLLQNNWNTKNISFGTKTSTFENYDIYFDNGYRVRSIYNTLFNIVFTDKYQNPVIDDIKVGDSLDEIKEKLGDGYVEQESIIEYMTKDIYICFSETEISVYPKIEYDYTSFEELLENYNEKKDFINFVNTLTDIWPDYSYYNYDESRCEIWYPLKGVKICNTNDSLDGIQIYSEYKGNLAQDKEDYYQLYYKQNESLIIEQDIKRNMSKNSGYSMDEGQSIEFLVLSDFNNEGKEHNIRFVSLNENYPDCELSKDIFADKTYWYDDYNFIYSIRNQGIYIYNLQTRTTKALVEGKDNFDVTNFDYNTKVITYDGKDVKIEL